jgi:hypothetical protein
LLSGDLFDGLPLVVAFSNAHQLLTDAAHPVRMLVTHRWQQAPGGFRSVHVVSARFLPF